MLQQLRLALGPCTHVLESLLRVVSHGEDVVGPHEDVHLAKLQVLARDLDRVHHHEERVAILLDLGSLVAMVRVFDGQLVEVELDLHLLELSLAGITQGDPHEAVGPPHVVVDRVLVDVRQLAPVLVGYTVDEHGADDNAPGVESGHAAGFLHALRPSRHRGGVRPPDGLQRATFFEVSGENLRLPPVRPSPLSSRRAAPPSAGEAAEHTRERLDDHGRGGGSPRSPHCGGRFRIARIGRRVFRHSEVTAVPGKRRRAPGRRR